MLDAPISSVSFCPEPEGFIILSDVFAAWVLDLSGANSCATLNEQISENWPCSRASDSVYWKEDLNERRWSTEEQKSRSDQVVRVASTAWEDYLFLKVIKDLVRDLVTCCWKWCYLGKDFLSTIFSLVAEKNTGKFMQLPCCKGPIPFAYLWMEELLLKFISLKNICPIWNLRGHGQGIGAKCRLWLVFLMLLAVASKHQRQAMPLYDRRELEPPSWRHPREKN